MIEEEDGESEWSISGKHEWIISVSAWLTSDIMLL